MPADSLATVCRQVWRQLSMAVCGTDLYLETCWTPFTLTPRYPFLSPVSVVLHPVVPTYTWEPAQYCALWCRYPFLFSVCLSHTVVQTYRWPAPCTVPYMGSWRHCGPCVGTLLFACHISHSLFVGYFSHGVIASGNKSTVSDKDPRPKMINPLPWWNFDRTCTSLCSLKVNICCTRVLCVPLIVRIRQCIHHLRLRREGGRVLLPISRSKPATFWSWVQSSTTAPPAIIATDKKALTGPLHWWNTIFSNSFCKHCSSVCGVKTCFEFLHSFVTQSGLDHQVTVYINDVPTSCASGVDCSFTWSGADTPTITAITPTTGNLLTFWAQSASSLLQDSYIYTTELQIVNQINGVLMHRYLS